METNQEDTNSPIAEGAIADTALRAEIAASAADLRALKRWWRLPPAERPAPPTTRSGLASVRDAKLRATLLHLALAHARRRLHARTWRGEAIASLEEQARRLTEELARLGKLTVTTPALDEAWRARLEVMLRRP